jgi:pimeloyl-ACP methyl ester carboxylesterase
MTKSEQDANRAPWTFAEPWGGTSHLVDLDGPVHWVDFGGPSGTTPIVLVHGLGGSHLNWVRIAPTLATRTRVLALDLAGFGLTAAGTRSASVQANAELVDRFIREVVGGPAVLIGNSMGGMISVLEADTHPDSVAGLVLIDPSLPVPRRVPDVQVASQFLLYAIPFLGERYLAYGKQRMTDRQLVQRVVDLCFADPSKASVEVIDAGIALAGQRRLMPPQEAAFLQAARSLMRIVARPQRYQALLKRIDAPVQQVHGRRERLVPVAAARKAAADNPDWESVILPGIGHTPQLESSESVLEHVTQWLDRHELAMPSPAPTRRRRRTATKAEESR